MVAHRPSSWRETRRHPITLAMLRAATWPVDAALDALEWLAEAVLARLLALPVLLGIAVGGHLAGARARSAARGAEARARGESRVVAAAMRAQVAPFAAALEEIARLDRHYAELDPHFAESLAAAGAVFAAAEDRMAHASGDPELRKALARLLENTLAHEPKGES